MKKLFTFCAIALFAAFSVNAQVSFGVKAGTNFSFLVEDYGDGSETSDVIVGFQGGVVADIELSEMFHLQPELLFSSEGGKFDDGVDSESISVSFLQLPVVAKIYLGEKFNIHAGPQFSLLLDVENFEGSLGDFFNTFNVGLNSGVGFDISEHFFIDATFNLMLTNLAKESNIDSRQHSVKIGVGYKF